jgi:hypothetical protein
LTVPSIAYINFCVDYRSNYRRERGIRRTSC